MNKFEDIKVLVAHTRFTICEAYAKEFKFLVVMKKCEFSNDAEAEGLIRWALMKAKGNAYTQPLLSISADLEPDTKKKFIILVWKKGDTLDIEVTSDQRCEPSLGKKDFGKLKKIYTHPGSKVFVAKALNSTLKQEVVCKVMKVVHFTHLNSIFKEALAHAKCTHENICEFLDFRLFRNKRGRHCAYIVTELLEHDLSSEIEERKGQLYEETELLEMLRNVTGALMHAKFLNLAHRDIKPANILRGPSGLKLTDFGAVWLKGEDSETESAAGTYIYMSPEAYRTLGNSDLLQRPFESDVFSLGMTMLHLAALKVPSRKMNMNDSELEAWVQQEVRMLSYSEKFQHLLTAMLRSAPQDRPPLESILDVYTQAFKENAGRAPDIFSDDYGNAEYTANASGTQLPIGIDSAQNLCNWGNDLQQQGNNEIAAIKYAEAQDIFSKFFSKSKDAAINLIQWGTVLGKMGHSTEEVKKYEEAGIILSQFPNDKVTARNFFNWGFALQQMGNCAEALSKFEAAHAIYSQYFPKDKETALNFMNWGFALGQTGKHVEAAAKYKAADDIYSFYPADISTASNLTNWGIALWQIDRSAEAISKYAKAESIYSLCQPDGKSTAENLMNLGIALRNIESHAKAVIKHEIAHAIYIRLYPNCKDTGKNLRSWGLALKQMGNCSEALTKYEAAHTVYCQFFPNDKDTAVNLMDWGILLRYSKNCVESVLKHAAADEINSSRFTNDKDTAKNLYNWGIALMQMGNCDEAAQKYAAADAVYSQFFPNDKETAGNRHNWGIALMQMGNCAEAISKYEAAHAIYSLLSPYGNDTARNRHNWGTALMQMGNCAEAAQKYEAAHAIFSLLSPYGKDTARNLHRWGCALAQTEKKAQAAEILKKALAINNAIEGTSQARICKK